MDIIIVILVIFVAVLPFYLIDRRERIKTMKTNFKKNRDTFERRWTYLSGFSDNETDIVLNSSYEEMEKNNFSLYRLHVLGRTRRAKQVDMARQRLEQWQNFYAPFSALADSKLLDPNHYGGIQSDYWNSIQTLAKEDAHAQMMKYYDFLSSGMPDQICSIQLDVVLRIIWRYGTDKVYSAHSFEQAFFLFRMLCDIAGVSHPDNQIDILLSELYAFKGTGGDGAIHSRIRDILKQDSSAKQLTQLCSGLMWLGAHEDERTVLQHMLSSGMEMPRKAQERLKSLSTGGGNGPIILNLTDDDHSLHFDVSALAWNDTDYNSLFDNLAFQDKKLTYALAVRDETKGLTLPSAITLPNHPVIIQKLRQIFTEDYGDLVNARLAACIAHSGTTQENMDCILVQSAECHQMGILVYISKIGKRINIKFYTLFIPSAFDIAVQKQQAISLYKKLSPSVSGWEESIKENVLKGIQELLNSSFSNSSGADSSSGSNVPIF